MGKQPRKIRTVDENDTTMHMMSLGGGSKRHPYVIDTDGWLKWWLGMAWIKVRKATAEDRERWPSVRRKG